MVTYLLGAGASCGKLPLLADLADDIKNFTNFIRDNYGTIQPHDQDAIAPYIEFTNISIDNLISKYCDDLDVLVNNISKSIYNSIDEYANYLIVNHKIAEYDHLRGLFSSYLHLRQNLVDVSNDENLIDKRYTTFILKLRNGGELMDKDVSILSWNYDTQFEIAYAKLSDKSPFQVSSKINVSSLQNYEYKIGPNFNLFKINGSSHLYRARASGQKDIDQLDNQLKNESGSGVYYTNLYRYLYSIYTFITGKSNYIVDLQFSWHYGNEENSLNSNIYLQKIRERIRETTTLIVIGYSFHPFNRLLDSYLLSSMGDLNKVIIQDFNCATVEQSMRSIDSFDLYINRNDVRFTHVDISTKPFKSFEIA